MMESIAQQAAKDARDVFSDDRQAQAAIGYVEQLIYAALRNVEYDLSDPVTVHANMLRGTIAKPTVEQIVHLYGREAFQPMIDVAIAKALEKACLAVSEHADWPEDEHGRTEQVGLFARVINAIRAITPALSPAPTDAAHVNETQNSEHDAGNVLTAAQAREAALLERASVLCQQEADRGQKNGQFGYHLGAVACRDAILALINEART